MALTLSKVAAWQPNTLQTCAENLASLNQQLASSLGDLRTAKTRLSDAWEGWAADAATAKTQRHAGSGDDLVDVLTRTSQTFTWGRAALVAAQDALDEVVRAAEAEGCKVDDDGTARPPPVSAPTDDLTPGLVQTAAARDASALAFAQARAQAVAMAARYTRLIQSQLQAAAATDAEVARTLSGIMLPTGIAESAAETAGAMGGVELGGTDLALQVAFPDGWQLSQHLRPLTAAEWTALVGAGGAAGLPIIASLAVKKDPTKNDDTGYYGGGAVEGPDGRLYPLVAPQVVIDGVLYGGGAQAAANRIVDLDGADNRKPLSCLPRHRHKPSPSTTRAPSRNTAPHTRRSAKPTRSTLTTPGDRRHPTHHLDVHQVTNDRSKTPTR